MASPQVENGFMMLANEIICALARITLTAYEVRVLWAIFRKTYGFNKKMDHITNGQFSEITGLERRDVRRALDRLLLRNMIIKITDGRKNYWGFQKDYDRWKVDQQGWGLTTPHVGARQPPKKGAGEPPTKDNKDTHSKDSQQEALPDLSEKRNLEKLKEEIAHFCDILKSNDQGFNPFKLLGQHVKAGVPTEVTFEVFKKMVKYRYSIQDFWAYASRVLNDQYPKFNLQQDMKRSEWLKKEPVDLGSILRKAISTSGA